MSYASVERLFNRWLNEPDFRAELCADPERAVRRHGFELSEEEWAALRRFDWTLAEDEPAGAEAAAGDPWVGWAAVGDEPSTRWLLAPAELLAN
jgi:hypothetical protein